VVLSASFAEVAVRIVVAAAVGATFLVASAVLLAAPEDGPAVVGEASLYRSSGSADCSSGACCCCEWSPPLPRRHDVTDRLPGDQAALAAGASSAGMGGAVSRHERLRRQ